MAELAEIHGALDAVPYEIHPVCALFPEHDAATYGELLDSIRRHGLFPFQPIVRDREGRILDGRHRLRACIELGIEPKFVTFDGDEDAAARYAFTANMTRRHLLASQRAMIAARAARLTGDLSLRATARAANVDRGTLRQANVVLDHAPDWADNIVGGNSLSYAYYIAMGNKSLAKKAHDEAAGVEVEASVEAHVPVEAEAAIEVDAPDDEPDEDETVAQARRLLDLLTNLAPSTDADIEALGTLRCVLIELDDVLDSLVGSENLLHLMIESWLGWNPERDDEDVEAALADA
jgi:ParB-like chromosome segregation protein Spo0J